MNRIITCTQQSDLWIAARRGRVTGSRLGDVMAPPTTKASTRGGVKMEAGSEAADRATYRKELIVERITGRAVNHPPTRAMLEGVEREPHARMLYEAYMQQVVELVGFALHPTWDWFGSSADGLVSTDGGVELKSPTEMVHDSYVADIDLLVKEYRWQVLGNLICFPERKWWDLASFNPYFPDDLKLIVFRMWRADYTETIRQIEESALAFNLEIEAAIAKRGLKPTAFEIMPEQDAPITSDGYDPSKPFHAQDLSFLEQGNAALCDIP